MVLTRVLCIIFFIIALLAWVVQKNKFNPGDILVWIMITSLIGIFTTNSLNFVLVIIWIIIYIVEIIGR